ncbi:MAG: hypothetical protein FWD06_06625 [Oscillospiraceae bacterium]|nr:hypothetical protein [Oscillospiraceae bacterium]
MQQMHNGKRLRVKKDDAALEELCALLAEGRKAVLEGRVRPMDDVFDDILRKHEEKYGL